MSQRYIKAREAFEYLESVAELDDQVELDAQREQLMRNPTKSFAAGMYESGICLWFKEHGNHNRGRKFNAIFNEYCIEKEG